jgi:cell volume regulation protein A
MIGWVTIGLFLWKFTDGPALGWLIARGAVFLFSRLKPQERGCYYVLLVGVTLLSHGLTELAHGSGMLAAFTAGFVMGNSHFIYTQGARNFLAALSTIANIGAFVLMGLLVFPHHWAGLWADGLLLFAVLTFIARPAAVWLGTLGMGIGVRDKLFMGWAGLRGAVPGALATFPLTESLPAGEDVFNLVFFAVLLSVALRGGTLGAVARALRLSTPLPANAALRSGAGDDGQERPRSGGGRSTGSAGLPGLEDLRPAPAARCRHHPHHPRPRGGRSQGQHPPARLGSDHRAGVRGG